MEGADLVDPYFHALNDDPDDDADQVFLVCIGFETVLLMLL
jgi:hypothetical protein